jgi:hypothetical protein
MIIISFFLRSMIIIGFHYGREPMPATPLNCVDHNLTCNRCKATGGGHEQKPNACANPLFVL